MRKSIRSSHFNDADGYPDGGRASAVGLEITWQKGPLGEGRDRLNPNGAVVSVVILAAVDRLEYLQTTPLADPALQNAITNLFGAIGNLEQWYEP